MDRLEADIDVLPRFGTARSSAYGPSSGAVCFPANPIRRDGGTGSGVINSRIGSKTTRKLPVVFLLQFVKTSSEAGVSREHRPEAHESYHNRDVHFDGTFLFRTLEHIETPCSVKANGGVRRPPRPFALAFCNSKDCVSSGLTGT
jgi:hypothetical protein